MRGFARSDIYDKDKIHLEQKAVDSVNQVFSRSKAKINKEDRSNLIYQIKCKGDESDICQKVYVDTSKSKLKTRLSLHKSDIKILANLLNKKQLSRLTVR